MSVLGVVVLIRHGDRLGFYQDPTSYTASATALTALGAQEEYALGQLIRALYLNASSPSDIAALSHGAFQQSQVTIQADAGGEGGVILDSTVALTQGLWPNTTLFNSTLANGTTVFSPLNGYQYIPVGAVNPNNDVSLEGWSDCTTFTTATTAFYNTSIFAEKAKQAAPFLSTLQQYLDGRTVSLQNMWNIFDYVNVNYIHNGSFAKLLPDGYLNQTRALADWHEYNVFSSPSPEGPGNIAGRTVLPSILTGLQNIANASSPVKMVINGMAYKPFLSLFNMTGVAYQHPGLAGIVDYASAVVLEVRSASPEPVVRFQFKNGTADFATYNWLNQTGDVALSTVLAALQPAAVNSTEEWCAACANEVDRGCAAFYSTQLRPTPASHSRIGALGAGFVGAAAALAFTAAALGVLLFLGLLSLGRGCTARRRMSHGVPVVTAYPLEHRGESTDYDGDDNLKPHV